MRMHVALLIAAVFSLSRLMELPERSKSLTSRARGSWRGWVTGEQGDERATMIVSADGSYKASTTSGSTTEVRSIFKTQAAISLVANDRTASLSEDKGKTVLSVKPEDPNYRTGTGEYERVKQ